jgi:hypothetical protein
MKVKDLDDFEKISKNNSYMNIQDKEEEPMN